MKPAPFGPEPVARLYSSPRASESFAGICCAELTSHGRCRPSADRCEGALIDTDSDLERDSGKEATVDIEQRLRTLERKVEELERQLEDERSSQRRTVEAREFVLVDEHGNRQAVLADTGDGPLLAFVGKHGLPRAAVGVVKKVPGMRLYDPDGTSRVTLGLPAEKAELHLEKAGGGGTVSLTAAGGGGSLALTGGEEQGTQAFLGTSELDLYRDEDRTHVVLGTDAEGVRRLAFYSDSNEDSYEDAELSSAAMRLEERELAFYRPSGSDESTYPRATFGVSASESGTAGLRLYNEYGENESALLYVEKRTPQYASVEEVYGLGFCADGSSPAVVLGQAAGDPALTLYDREGRARLSAGITKNGARLLLYNTEQEPRAALGCFDGQWERFKSIPRKVIEPKIIGEYGPNLFFWDESNRTRCLRKGLCFAPWFP